MQPGSPPQLSPLQHGSSSMLPEQEMPPITPMAAAGNDDSFARRDRPAGAGNGAGSLLDLLLTSALEEVPTVQHRLPGPLAAPAAPAPRAPASAAAPLICPGAPKRVRNLLPPPEVPADVLAALRPITKPRAAPSPAGGDGDTATSAAPAPSAIQQACAWLSNTRGSHGSHSLL
ncbi:hypothetical protein ABPG75_009307 [Micractinium tetrahymenae]